MSVMTAIRPIDPDELTLDGVRRGALRDVPVAVLGFARSGIALARFLFDAGARVTVYDGRTEAELAEYIRALEGRKVQLLLGPDVEPADAWRDAALVTTSPSINPDYPTTEPRLRAALAALVDARRSGDPSVPAVVSEPDLFLRLCPAMTIGVTGTKGKTTTASLTAALLAVDVAHPVVLGGNIGTPIVELLPELTPEHRVVYELSELQLPTLSRGTHVAVYTNVTSDHLDRHGSLDAYRQVKRRLAELADADGAVVLNADDAVVAGYGDAGSARAVTYGFVADTAVGVDDGWIVDRGVEPLAEGVDHGRVVRVDDLRIPGAHNVSNAMAAITVARLLGVPRDEIRTAAREFRGVEHRLEEVTTLDGVRFVNDSQGTQPDAVIAALRAFEPPVVLIAGGRDKGVDLGELPDVVAQRAAAAVVIGESGPALGDRFANAGLRRVEPATSLDDAVELADAIARAIRRDDETATVLLSPAAASFDMFVDYAARGRAFKTAVARLEATRRGASR
jgi:UDP-N-acetylmuramoylalanine--D-glutamate ligase